MGQRFISAECGIAAGIYKCGMRNAELWQRFISAESKKERLKNR